ncbi:MAG: S8 family serine peptidase [Micrococcus sp.]|nr:S8 family serine peptidase [Micrococcus sp.]
MSHNPQRPGRFRAVAATLAGAGLLAAPLVGAPAMASPVSGSDATSTTSDVQITDDYTNGRYFVVLKDDPSVTYGGGTDGLAATAAEGGQFEVNRPEVGRYEQYLKVQQSRVAQTVGASTQMQFARAVNAFVADLTADQARTLAKDERVLSVGKDERLSTDYSSTDFLNLPGANGAWNTVYGGEENAGKGVVVGVIDTGIHPDNPFIQGEPVAPLSGQPQVGQPYRTADGRIAVLKADGTTAYGDCQEGPDFPASSCDSKLIGAYAFADDFLRSVPAANRHPAERISPLGVFSHGTHVATTVLGNTDVEQSINGYSYGTGAGVAPAAHLISYKICWEDNDPDTGGCYTSASIAAIEKAIENNVDVLNYSISGNNNSITDAVALAFRSAAEAGIFVAASAGNSGPSANTVNHSSPWLTTVAASTFSNELTATIEFADGTRVRGASSTRVGVEEAEVIHASEVGRAGADANQVRLCYPGTLDAAAAADKIVLCERGVIARVDKSKAVAEADGVGMILVNVPSGSLDADVHSVPSVHVDDNGIIAKVRAGGERAAIVVGDTTGRAPDPLPQVAGFSSRGPSNAVNQEFLNPDVAAPGVNVIAGVSPLDPGYDGNEFGLMSGTSMAAPNVAGMAALMVGKNPSWSPMALKSAMMTTATDLYNADGSVNVDNFATGAGNADPRAMAAPGLVYEADARQWDSLLLGDIAGRDVNLPSVAIPDVVGSATVKRTLTAKQAGTWTFSGSVPGFAVTAQPSTLSLAAGQSAEVTLTFTRTDAPLSEWRHGSMSWNRPAAASVTSPVTLKAMAATVTSNVEGEGANGSETVEILPGVTGQLEASVLGLGRAETAQITKTPGAGASTVANASSHVETVDVAEGTRALSLAVNAGRVGADWDMYVITPSGQLIRVTTAADSEQLTLNNPAAGRYTVVYHLYSTPDGAADTATTEVLRLTGDAGNLTVTPNPVPVTSGTPTQATLAWSGLTEGTWRGLVTWAPGVTTTVTVVVGAGEAPVEPEVCEAPDFRDNAPGSTYYEPVRWMQCNGITTGYADGTYRKYNDITRGESLTFLFRYIDPEHTAPETSPFPDVRAGSTFYPAITWAAAQGVTTGYTDGTFKPGRDVTRGEFAAFVYRALAVDPFTAPAQSPYADVPAGSAHYEAIAWLHAQGLIRGYSNGTYAPHQQITRGEVAVIMERIDAMMNEG